MIERLSNFAEWIYFHTGAYLPLPLILALCLQIDAFDMLLGIASMLSSLAGFILPGWLVTIGFFTKGFEIAATVVMVALSIPLAGRHGFKTVYEVILAILFGFFGIGVIIELFPITTVAFLLAVLRSDDNRRMLVARTWWGKIIQITAIASLTALSWDWVWWTVKFYEYTWWGITSAGSWVF